MPRKAAARPRRDRSARSGGPARPASAGPVFVTRQVHFNAAHRMHNRAMSPAWNRRRFGPCAEVHGHNYVLEVTVRGAPDPATGYVVDLGALKRIISAAVADKCDHRSLNDGVDFLRGLIPSAENLAVAFWREIAPRLPAGRLHCVRLYETPRNFAEYYGPERG